MLWDSASCGVGNAKCQWPWRLEMGNLWCTINAQSQRRMQRISIDACRPWNIGRMKNLVRLTTHVVQRASSHDKWSPLPHSAICFKRGSGARKEHRPIGDDLVGCIHVCRRSACEIGQRFSSRLGYLEKILSLPYTHYRRTGRRAVGRRRVERGDAM